jgi:hypothetical protein
MLKINLQMRNTIWLFLMIHVGSAEIADLLGRDHDPYLSHVTVDIKRNHQLF